MKVTSPRRNSRRQFVLTCSMLIWVFSAIEVNAMPSTNSSSFKIEGTVELEATVSCGREMFQNQQALTCNSSVNEGDSHHKENLAEVDCSACHPSSDSRLSINSTALAIDHTREWKSLPRAPDSHFQELNITINFPQVFKVQHISVKAGSTPLPAVWALEESHDFTSDFKAIRYYVADEEDCYPFFGLEEGPLCFLTPNFSWKETENVDVTSSRVRLRFLTMWSNFGRNGSNLDYYSLSEISIEGQCECNGHADECALNDKGRMACLCQHNTCGEQCQTCCHGYALDDDGDCAVVELQTNSTASVSNTLELREDSTASDLLVNASEVHLGKEESTVASPGGKITAADDDEDSSPVTSSEILTLTTGSTDGKEESTLVVFSGGNVEAANQTEDNADDLLVPTETSTPLSSDYSTRDTRQTVVSTHELDITTTYTSSSTNRPFTESRKAVESTVLQKTSTLDQKTVVSNTQRVTPLDDSLDEITSQAPVATTEQPAMEGSTSQGVLDNGTAAHTVAKDATTETAAEPDLEVSTISMSTPEQSKFEPSTVESVFSAITESVDHEATTKPSDVETTGNVSTTRINFQSAVDHTTVQSTTDAIEQLSTEAFVEELTTTKQALTEADNEDNVTSPATVQSSTMEAISGSSTKETLSAKATTAESATDRPTVEEETVADHESKEMTSTKEATDASVTKETTTTITTTKANGQSFPRAETTTTAIKKSIDKSTTNLTTAPTAADKPIDASTTTESTATLTTTEKPTDDGSMEQTKTPKEITSEFPIEITSATEAITYQKPDSSTEEGTKTAAASTTTSTSDENPTNGSATEYTMSTEKFLPVSTSRETATTEMTSDKKFTDQTTTEEETHTSATRQPTITEAVSDEYTIGETSTIETSADVKPTGDDDAIEQTITKEQTTAAMTSDSTSPGETTSGGTIDESAADQPTVTTPGETTSEGTTDESAASQPTVTTPGETTSEGTTDESAASQLTVTTPGETTSEGTTDESAASQLTVTTPGETTSEGTTDESAASQPTITTPEETTSDETTDESAASQPTITDTTSSWSGTEQTTASLEDTAAFNADESASVEITTTGMATVNDTASDVNIKQATATEESTSESVSKEMTRTRATTSHSIIKYTTSIEATEATTGGKTTEDAAFGDPTQRTIATEESAPATATSTFTFKETTTTESTPVETMSETTSMQSTTLSSGVPTTAEATTLHSSVDAITVSTSVETTTENFPPLVKITSVPTTVETSAEPTTVKTTTDTTIVKTTAEATTVKVSSDPSTMEVTSEGTSVKPTETTTVKTTTAPTTVKTTTETTIVKTTAEPTTMKTTSEPSTIEGISGDTTVKPPEATTVKTTTEPSTAKTTAKPTAVETLTEPPSLGKTSKPTTVKTTTEPFPPLVETTTEPFPPLVETTVPTTVETTTEPTTVKKSMKPSIVKTTEEPFPPLVETTTEPFPPLVEMTTEPFPSLVETTLPTTMKTTTEPTTVKSTTEVTTVKTTAASTTSGVLSEEQARVVFGNLPKGVCYCNKYATADNQCFPTALHKPCICRANYAGVRCERCAAGYFNAPICAPCRCNKYGSANLNCDKDTGRCTCKAGFSGKKCNACPLGKFNFPTCSSCQCNPSGSYGQICDPYNGQCPCRYGVWGRQCNKCPAGYYNFPNCRWCGCNPLTTTENICEDYRGGLYGYRCLCKPNFQGPFCGECQRGYYDFPICKKCSCSPRGYGSCNEFGRCVCDAGYAGSQCDRCASGYYGFPYCKPCNCNTFGSYSTQCNHTSGQCACRPNIRGGRCNRCAKGMVGFPTCVECDCNPDGTRFLPGLTSTMCYGSAKYQCLCKSHVVGRTCDRCVHGYFNFSGGNPSGCSACRCSTRGTLSGTRHCHAQSGRCDCKNHVIGAKCDDCRDGYHGMRTHDIFGCKACKCDPGGSTNRNCFKHLGNCQCVSGVEGKKCDSLSLSRPLYFPTLYQIYVELEGAVFTSNSRVRIPIGADTNVFPSYSGVGYAIFPAYKPYAVAVYIPRTRKYRVIFHYALKENLRTSAKVELYPRDSKIPSHGFEVQFSPRNPSQQQTKDLRTTVNRSGMNREFLMNKGAWTVVVTSHSSMLLLDYIVFLPEDYYKANLLKDIPSEPCLLRTTKPENCDMYTYYEPKGPSIVAVSGDKAYTLPLRGRPDVFMDPRFDLRDQRLSNMALLGRNQPSLGFDISVPEAGPYVLMVTYLHPERFTLRAFVRVGYERGQLEILPCKYLFACRQFVREDTKRPKYFELAAAPDANAIKMESSAASAKIAVISITAIPLAKWNTQYIQPELLCRMYNNSCISSNYEVPPDAVQLFAFSRRTQEKVISIFTGAVNAAGVYYLVFHYQQRHSLSKKVAHISIAGQVKSNISVTFRYCAASPGCRVVLGEEDGLMFQFGRGIFTATVEHERRTHLAYVLLVPQDSYSTSLLEFQSTDRVTRFLQNCGKDQFHIEPVKTGRQCREDVFSLTIGFNKEPLQCRCNLLGSKSTFCEQFGGQCPCLTNVVGRRCDRCVLGHSSFPRCRRCGCHEVGSVSPSCTSYGRCRCKPGFGGYKCDRCQSSGYYGFPDCKLCACNSLGSLSSFCRSRDGQCQCRRNFQGQKCDECRVGYYDFPRCKACSCNPAGIKLLPGEKNGCGSVNDTHCRCKDNVMGDDCDSCKPFHFNLQINNPLGCQSCDCNTNGTLGSIGTCHEATGQCMCKSHVTGRQCGRCKAGYHSQKGEDVFGCKRCLCNAGGSVSPSCNAVTGACSCLRGVGGTQCDRVVSDNFYYPTLHQYKIELEEGLTDNGRAAYFRHSESEFPAFSWRGYVVFSQSQNSLYIMIDVPRTSKYQLIFHYLLSRYAPVTALVKFIPTLDSASFPSGTATEQILDVRFRSTASWIFALAEFLVVRDNWGDAKQIMLSQGKWKLTIAAPASDLFVDYLVLLPQEYYRPRNLAMQVSNPCTLSRDDKYCVHFTYPSLRQAGFVTIQAEDNSVVGGIRRNQRAGDIPFQGLLLSGSRNVMSVRLPPTIRGQFVLVASYFHNSDDEETLSLFVRTGDETFKAKMSILSCRYRFGCRQVAIDDNHDVCAFSANSNEVTTVSISTTFTVALDFITAIPLSKWDQKLVIPAEQCASNGYSCIQTSYPDPTDAVKIEIEDRSSGGDRAPYYILDRRARLKHLKKGEKSVFVSGTARSGRYYVIVHFYQPNYSSFLGKVVVSGQRSTSALLTFRYCPYVSGCRAIGTSQFREGMSESIYIGRQNNILISLVIPGDKGVWIDYVLLVPVSSFSPSLLEIKPIDVTQDFIQDCGQHDFYLKESSSKFCLSSAFTITTRFNHGALACDCDNMGSTKTSCQSFGGQCACRPNVIGRACDRCKSGYSGFPYCRKITS